MEFIPSIFYLSIGYKMTTFVVISYSFISGFIVFKIELYSPFESIPSSTECVKTSV